MNQFKPIQKQKFWSIFNRMCQRLVVLKLITKMEHSQSKLPRLAAFKTVQEKFHWAGISPELVTQSYPLNGRIFIGFLLLCSVNISICLGIFNGGDSFSQYTLSICMVSASGLYIGALVISILNVGRLFEFIVRCDSMLNISKTNP